MSTSGPTAGAGLAPARPATAPGHESVHRSAVTTTDPDVASAVIERLYTDVTYEMGPEPEFRLQLSSAVAGPLLLGWAHYGFPARVQTGAVDAFQTLSMHAGSMTLTSANRPARTMRPGGSWLWEASSPLALSYESGSTFTLLQLPMPVIAEVAAEATGADTSGAGGGAAVRFLSDAGVHAAAEQYWAGLMRFAYQQAVAPDSALNSPLVRAQLVRSLAGAALTVFPNTTMTVEHLPGPGRVGPTTVRRALAHLHAHAAEPLTVADLAAAAGIGVRALQQAFVQHVGATPTAHLRQVRLERAHQDLLAGDPRAGDTVAAIAASWGFAHPGRFAAAHQQRYGSTPAATLRP